MHHHPAAVADHQHPAAAQHAPSTPLEHLDESVLIHILSWLPEPQQLASTCRTLHAASTTALCRQLWFQRWYPCHPTASQRPLVLAALSWHGLRPSAGATQEEELTPHLVKLLCGTAALYLPQAHEQGRVHGQQQQPLLPHQLPNSISHAVVTRPLHSAQQQLRLIQQMCPWHEHLLIPAAAAAGNTPLLQQLLAEYGPPAASAERRCAPCESCSCGRSSQAGTSSSAASSSSGASCAKASGALRLQRWLWHYHQQQQPRQDQQQQPSPRVRWGQLVQPLPAFPGLQAFRHNVLQTGLIAAARGGFPSCLQLLLGQLADCQASKWDCAEALTAVAEAAAAAGQLQCLQLVWQVLQPPQQQRQQQQQQRQQKAMGAGLRELNHVVQQLSSLQLAAAQTDTHQQQLQLQRLQQNMRALCQRALEVPGELPEQQQEQEHEQQEQETQPQAPQPHPALQVVGVSTYLLVAAARSGSCEVLDAVMQHMTSHIQKQQLPAALAAAGQLGHTSVVSQLLQHPELSSRPLQLAASDAAVHGWPPSTLVPLLQHMAAAYNQELIPLLAKPLVLALQQQRQEVVGAVMDVLEEEAALDQGDLLADALLLLAYQGQAERVSWIIRVAPTVLVKLGPRAAAAALEGGHPRLAQLILDRGGERPPTFKAASKRGQLTAAVAAGDAAAVRELLQEVRLPLVWSCEATAVGGQGGATAHAAAGGAQHAAAAAAVGPFAVGPAGGAAGAAVARQTHPTHCLLTLLKRAALLRGPGPDSSSSSASVDILRQLLWVLTDGSSSSSTSEGQSGEQQHVLLMLAKACFEAGRAAQLEVVVEAAGRPRPGQRRGFLRELRLHLQLPSSLQQSQPELQQQEDHWARADTTNSSSGSAGSSGGSSAAGQVSGSSSSSTLDAALALIAQPQATDLVSSLLSQAYFAVCMPGEYLGATARPMQPAVHIPSLKTFTQLLRRLALAAELPPGARSRDLPLFRLLVRTVLQACDVDLLHALLLFMQQHGAAMMGSMPEDALRALRVEAEAVQAAEAQQGVDGLEGTA